MKKFVLLYIGGEPPKSKEEGDKFMKAWIDWFTSLGSKVIDQGNPFTPMAKTITPSGTIKSGSNGTIAGGYSIIQAESLDKAVDLAKNCPALQSGSEISVYETFEIMAT